MPKKRATKSERSAKRALTLLASNVRHHRTNRGLTQRKLADKVGIHERTLAAVERGSRQISIKVVAGIADALDVELHELFVPRQSSPRKVGRPAG